VSELVVHAPQVDASAVQVEIEHALERRVDAIARRIQVIVHNSTVTHRQRPLVGGESGGARRGALHARRSRRRGPPASGTSGGNPSTRRAFARATATVKIRPKFPALSRQAPVLVRRSLRPDRCDPRVYSCPAARSDTVAQLTPRNVAGKAHRRRWSRSHADDPHSMEDDRQSAEQPRTCPEHAGLRAGLPRLHVGGRSGRVGVSIWTTRAEPRAPWRAVSLPRARQDG
jgi:hypothetical protein